MEDKPKDCPPSVNECRNKCQSVTENKNNCFNDGSSGRPADSVGKVPISTDGSSGKDSSKPAGSVGKDPSNAPKCESKFHECKHGCRTDINKLFNCREGAEGAVADHIELGKKKSQFHILDTYDCIKCIDWATEKFQAEKDEKDSGGSSVSKSDDKPKDDDEKKVCKIWEQEFCEDSGKKGSDGQKSGKIEMTNIGSEECVHPERRECFQPRTRDTFGYEKKS